MNSTLPRSGLYVITDTDNRSPDDIIEVVKLALNGNACMVQFRDKSNRQPLSLVKNLLTICQAKNIPFIINDNIHLASSIGADGVHLGKDDADINEALNLLKKDSIIGISCYDSLERAYEAESQGASYVAFGRFFRSRTKADAKSVNIEILRQAKLKIPVVAIGGITPKNGKCLLEAGAEMLAVVEGVFGQERPDLAALAYYKLFENNRN